MFPTGLAVALLAVAGLVTYLTIRPPGGPAPTDLAAAAVANARGVGHMEKFEFPLAAAEFETATKLAASWAGMPTFQP